MRRDERTHRENMKTPVVKVPCADCGGPLVWEHFVQHFTVPDYKWNVYRHLFKCEKCGVERLLDVLT